MSSQGYPGRTRHLPHSDVFSKPTHHMDDNARALLSYEKAKQIGLSYDMTIDDVLSLSPKFWQLHNDPVSLLDGAAFTLLAIQFNLCAGTVARYTRRRPELIPLVKDFLRFRKHGQFMLTELGHGLDISNIETTATLLPSGEFLLHSPTPSSAKFMPPTMPAGLPCVAVVFARLMVNGEFRGHRPFVVPLNDGKQMCAGVQSRLLPYRGGANPLPHALTTFTNVRLPRSALLGMLERPTNMHANLMDIIWRVAIGTMALGCVALPLMQCYATIGTMYSLRRVIGSATNPALRTPILTFRTQQAPILAVTANAYVMQAFQRWAVRQFCSASVDCRVRHGVAAIFKAVMVQHSQQGALSVSERCGAQGLFAHNQLTCLHNEMRGIAIAEGDILGLAIRLVNEILLGRYDMPPPADPNSLLARHEAGLLAELREVVRTLPHHRSDEVNRLVLPHCQPAMEAIGHRMAYDAAVAVGVRPCLVDLYVVNVVKLDSAWYAEHAGLGRKAQQEMETLAQDQVLPLLGTLVKEMDVFAYVTAPIVSDDRWAAFVQDLKVFRGNARVDPLEQQRGGRFGVETEMVRSHL
ncbi:acyl-CoA dehydrogenase NM domain-like protein [Lentinus tigrinus ALCF2SS1-7]|uniref:acyl-CoA dehydrogenase NM domain-like protein n=1 Tax=Lentinus tigrinus ALCF2SS1-7 TaxID=1328758 RepID=UPI001165CC38|nr:acyl-CoA dehydrogenase NM domain-like protein [Lentinus tigrinus ALCF2SS1-7]